MNISFQTFLFLIGLDRCKYANVSVDLDTLMLFTSFNTFNSSMCCKSRSTSADLDTFMWFGSFNAINSSMCCRSPNTSDDLDTFMWFSSFNAFNSFMCCKSRNTSANRDTFIWFGSFNAINSSMSCKSYVALWTWMGKVWMEPDWSTSARRSYIYFYMECVYVAYLDPVASELV